VVVTTLYENDGEKNRHRAAIHALARDLSVPADEITRLYEEALTELKDRAKIKNFLVVFAIRRVRQLLKTTTESSPAPTPPPGVRAGDRFIRAAEAR
jgi:hypothetical protein